MPDLEGSSERERTSRRIGERRGGRTTCRANGSGRRTVPQRSAGRPIAGAIALLALLTIGCAGASPNVIQTRGTESNAARSRQASKPVLATIEAAAIEALTAVHRETRRVGRRRLQVGVIRRSGDGYTYSEALRSESTVGSSRPLKVRYRMGPDAVATYVVHPRSGRHRIDRLAETPTPESRRIVDELDPRHRPLYLLTPSLEIVRHVHGRPVRTSERLSELFRERIR